ncbi:hypothetical protein C8F04DRAFT_1233692 [Mycena alexandri]|uniref:Uncharacterized protein n=1 Tax=Mycena alexandri TaxID=1745969 RepID=A0AAD6T048_9AGAR|nr:hypothetical protein C8F04DRAFT_1233692 [Mycena alexandri]
MTVPKNRHFAIKATSKMPAAPQEGKNWAPTQEIRYFGDTWSEIEVKESDFGEKIRPSLGVVTGGLVQAVGSASKDHNLDTKPCTGSAGQLAPSVVVAAPPAPSCVNFSVHRAILTAPAGSNVAVQVQAGTWRVPYLRSSVEWYKFWFHRSDSLAGIELWHYETTQERKDSCLDHGRMSKYALKLTMYSNVRGAMYNPQSRQASFARCIVGRVTEMVRAPTGPVAPGDTLLVRFAEQIHPHNQYGTWKAKGVSSGVTVPGTSKR